MNGNRACVSWFVVLVLGLVVLFVLPGTAAAAGDHASPPLGPVNQASGPAFAIPGVLSLAFGQDFTPQVEIPALNATASVQGLNIANGWNFEQINLAQKQPATNPNFTISDAMATVSAPSTGYSTLASAHVVLHPTSGNLQAEGDVSFKFDGQKRTTNLAIADGNAAFKVGPAVVQVTGLQTGAGAPGMDSLVVSIPTTGGSATLAGVGPAGTQNGWDSFTLAQEKVLLGNAGTLSNVQVQVAGPSANYSTKASMNYALNPGPVQANGQFTAVYNGLTRQTNYALNNANFVLSGNGWKAGFGGLNYQPTGMHFDTIAFGTASNLSGGVTNLQVSPAGVVSFDQAFVRYLPDPATVQGKSPIAGWEVVITPTSAGYVISTNTLVAPQSK